MMEENKKNELLKDEYLKLQDIYEDFDRRTLTIKGWAITICLGGIAVGFEKGLASLWILSGIAALLFWLIEAKWKTYQYANTYRIRMIEGYFRGDEDKKILYLYKSIILGTKVMYTILTHMMIQKIKK